MSASTAQPFAAALVLSLVLTRATRALARRYGLVAPPRSDRWHTRPTALLGGVAIWTAFMAAGLATGAFAGLWPLVGIAAYLFVVGLVDDLAGTLEGEASVLVEGETGWQYAFVVRHAGEVLAEGRAAVIHPVG